MEDAAMTVRELWDQVPGNLYAALDVSAAASESEIQRAWHRAARQSHPDAGGNDEHFQAVNVAYLVLSDPTHRRRYDRHLRIADAARTPRATTDTPEPVFPDVVARKHPGNGSPSSTMIWLMAIIGLVCVVMAYLVPWTTLVTGVGVGLFVMVRYLRMYRRQGR